MGARATWTGTIAFGLVVVPVKLYLATGEDDPVKFNQVHKGCGCKIAQRRFCTNPEHTDELPFAEVGKGYQHGTGMIELDDTDMASLPLATSKEIAVEQFIEFDAIDPLYFTGSKSYYIGPVGVGGEKAYKLLAGAMQATSKAGLVKVALRQRESLAVLTVRGDALILTTMLWPDEVRANTVAPVNTAGTGPAEVAQIAMAAKLIEAMTGEFDPSKFSDGYAAAVHAMIEAKLDGTEVALPEAKPEQTADAMLAALTASLEAVKLGIPGIAA